MGHNLFNNRDDPYTEQVFVRAQRTFMKKKNNKDAFSNVENKKNGFVYLAAIHIGFDYQLVMFRYM